MTLRSILHPIVLGCAAVAMLHQSGLLISGAWASGYLSGFVGGGTIFGYYCSHPNVFLRRFAWLAGGAGLFGWYEWINQGGSIWMSFLPLLIWLLYYGFQRPGHAGLRQVALAKPLLVAFAWGWVTVVLPAASAPLIIVGWMLAERAAFILALALAYDWVDRTYDRHDGLDTLARRLEIKRFVQTLRFAWLLSAISAVKLFLIGIYSFSNLTALLISLMLSAIWVPLVLEKKQWFAWQKHLIDAMMLLQTALVLLLR
jgi:4-hydroxybenzoate polyprenyltransferase